VVVDRRTDTTSRSAIWRLVKPDAASRPISRSPGVSSPGAPTAISVGGRAPSQPSSQRAASAAAPRALASRPASR
jgi:hypothetical protein